MQGIKGLVSIICVKVKGARRSGELVFGKLFRVILVFTLNRVETAWSPDSEVYLRRSRI
jgi:hypothetical protein